LAHLSGLVDLEYLGLKPVGGWWVNDAGLAHMKNCDNPKKLWLPNPTFISNRLSMAGILDLQKTLPNCPISFD
jgi:hypothetical protein